VASEGIKFVGVIDLKRLELTGHIQPATGETEWLGRFGNRTAIFLQAAMRWLYTRNTFCRDSCELSASLRRAVPCRNRLGYFSEK